MISKMHYLVEEIVNWSVMNQSCGHWLLGDTRHWFLGDAWHWLLGNALHFLIFTCQELHEMLPHQIIPNNLVFDGALKELTMCMQHQISEVFKAFIFFLDAFDWKKGRNILTLILDPGQKSLHLENTYTGCQATSILVASITPAIVVESYKLLTSNWLMSPQSTRWACGL